MPPLSSLDMGEIWKRGDDGRNQKTLSLPPPRSSRPGVGDVDDNDGVGVGDVNFPQITLIRKSVSHYINTVY